MYKWVLILLFLLSGCMKQEEVTKKYNDGTYEAICKGYGGDFKVTVVLKDDEIEDVYVLEHNETPSVGGVAIEQIINYMKDEGSSDIISGATTTSIALIDGINEAKKQAEI